MASVAAHPRFAHMVLRAQRIGAAELGCVLAALLSERDLFRGTGSSTAGGSSGQPGADLAARLRVLAGAGEPTGLVDVGGIAPHCLQPCIVLLCLPFAVQCMLLELTLHVYER